jgi:Cdc6-like AAA superfamily ATPase
MKSIIQNQLLLQPITDIILEDEYVFIRQKEVGEMFQMLNPNSKIKSPIEVEFTGDPLKFIWGLKGTGKTTMLKWFEKKITSIDIKVIYIDCKQFNTPNQLIDELYRQIKEANPTHISKHTNIRAAIADYIKEVKDKQVFLIMDEIDKPLGNSKSTQPDEFLHYLIRLVQENKEHLFKVVFSTNIVNIESILSDEVKSFLGFNRINFGVYTVPQMVSILEKRSRKALVPGSYDIKDLTIISHMVTEVFDGDIRTALNMTLKLAKKSDGKLDIGQIDKVIAETNAELLYEQLAKFPRGAQILLKSFVEKSKERMGDSIMPPELSGDEIYIIYTDFCEREGFKPSQKSMFYNYLNNLLDSLIISKKQNGYAISEDVKKLEHCLLTLV